MKMDAIKLLGVIYICSILGLQTIFADVSTTLKPHIIFIVADDLGWNDVGFHGSTEIPTPNIDALAYSGVILNNYYVQPICTPSRSALMTGYYPIHTGLNHEVIYGPQDYGVPLQFTLLPEYLTKLGYTTRHVGKWHLGMAVKELTPTHRGFHSHFGYWTGHQDYYDHSALLPGWWGYDMRRNMEVARDAYGHYTTDLFTNEAVNIIHNHNTSQPLFLYLAHLAVHSANPADPLQAPDSVVQKFSYIKDVNRRKFAGMLWKLDDSIGRTVKALDEAGILENSIIVFTTDNGGPAAGFNQNAASNWPLRGVKASLWEGGVRGAGFIWSPRLRSPGRISEDMFHITDWMPTLYAAAGGNVTELGKIDGQNLWSTLAFELPSSRHHFLLNYDPIVNGAGVRVGDYKLVYRPNYYGDHWDGWFGPSGRNESTTTNNNAAESSKPENDITTSNINDIIKSSEAGKAVMKLYPAIFKKIDTLRKNAEILCGPIPKNATKSCGDVNQPCLFNILSDPCEYHDISPLRPDVVSLLRSILHKYIATAHPPLNTPWDPAANPKYWEYTWNNWKDYPNPI